MARIRSIKPEYFSDEKIMLLSIPARLLFIGLWVFADDYGNQDASIPQTKARIFPADSIDIKSCLTELTTHGVLIEYQVSGKVYWNIPNFRKHQKINRPSTPRVPAPNQGTLIEASLRTHGGLTTGSGSGSGSGREEDLTRDEPARFEAGRSLAQEQNKIPARPNLVPPADRCARPSCTRRGSTKIDGKWFCSLHADTPTFDPATLISDNDKFLRGID